MSSDFFLPEYSGFGVPLFVIGMMVSAFALRVTSGAVA